MPGEHDEQSGADKRKPKEPKAKPATARSQRRKPRSAAPPSAGKRQQGKKPEPAHAEPPSGWARWWRRPDYVFSAAGAIFTGVLMALTGAYVWTTFLLWQETRASVETATAALKLVEMSERPWVVVESISIPRERTLESGTYAITFVNTGAVPAIGGQIRISTSIAASLDFAGTSIDEVEAKSMPLLAPNQRTEISIPYGWNDGELGFRPLGPLYIVAGDYRYLDSSGGTRVLRFCFSRDGYEIDEGGPWDPCPEHNTST